MDRISEEQLTLLQLADAFLKTSESLGREADVFLERLDQCLPDWRATPAYQEALLQNERCRTEHAELSKLVEALWAGHRNLPVSGREKHRNQSSNRTGSLGQRDTERVNDTFSAI